MYKHKSTLSGIALIVLALAAIVSALALGAASARSDIWPGASPVNANTVVSRLAPVEGRTFAGFVMLVPNSPPAVLADVDKVACSGSLGRSRVASKAVLLEDKQRVAVVVVCYLQIPYDTRGRLLRASVRAHTSTNEYRKQATWRVRDCHCR